MKSKTVLLALGAVVCGGFVASAEDLVFHDTSSGSSLNWNFCEDWSNWDYKSDPTQHKVPDENDDCVVSSLMNTPQRGKTQSAVAYVFKGRSIKVTSNGLGYYTQAPSSIEFQNKGLILTNGGRIRTRDAGASRGILKGKFSMDASATSKAPAYILATVSTTETNPEVEGCVQVDATFHGPADAWLLVTKYNDTYAGPAAVEFMGDASDFFGTVVADQYHDRVRTGCANFAGTVQVNGGGTYETCAAENGETGVAKIKTMAATSSVIVRPANTLKVANLELAGGTVTIRHDQQKGAGCLVVSETISASAKATLVADVGLDAQGAPHSYTVLKVKKSIGTIDQFFTWDTTGETTYTPSEEGDYYVLSAQNSNLHLTIPGGETKTMENLSIGGGTIEIGFDATSHQTGCAEFTGNFNLTEGGKLVVNVAEISSGLTSLGNIAGEQPHCAVLKAPADKLDPADVTLNWSAKGYSNLNETGFLPEGYADVATNDEGQVVFSVGYRPVVKRVRWEEAETETDKKQGPINDGNYWSDGEAPHADADYLLPYQSSTSGGPFQMTFTGMTFENHTYTFPGHSLTMGFYCSLPSGLAEFILNGDLTLLFSRNKSATSGFYFSEGQPDASGASVQKLTAPRLRVFPIKITTYPDFYNSWPGLGNASGRIGEVNAPLEGTEDSGIMFYNSSSSSAAGLDYEANFRLAQKSPDYKGAIAVCYNWGTYIPKATRPIRLRIADPLALGGAPGSFLYNALILTDWARLMPTENMTIATENRGVFVRGHGGFEVPSGVKLVLNERLTLGGECEKLGDGVLTLGSTVAPQFALEQPPCDPVGKVTISETPSEGTNVLKVTAGALAVTDKNAVKGLAVQFAGGAILTDPNAEEGSFARTYGGLYSNDEYGTVTTAEEGGKIGVAFDTTGRTEGETLTATICTVKTGTLTADSFALVKPWKGYALTVTSADGAEEGTTVFTATSFKKGMMILLK